MGRVLVTVMAGVSLNDRQSEGKVLAWLVMLAVIALWHLVVVAGTVVRKNASYVGD